MKTLPISIQIGLTHRCNLRCVHCDIWKAEKKEKELTTEEWKKVILKLKDWLGPFRLDIAEGEPFLRKDILDIILFCDENNIRTVVTTNGTLIEKEKIKLLSKIKSLTLNISLDGASPETHDYLRNFSDVYQKVMETLFYFNVNTRRCYIAIATILMGYNIDDIMLLLKKVLVDRLADSINFQALTHNFDAPYHPKWYEQNPLWPKGEYKEKILKLLDNLIELVKIGYPINNPITQLEAMKRYFNNPSSDSIGKCNAGERNFIINSSGKVLLCWNMEPVGNILDDEPEKIWNSISTNLRRRQIADCKRTCRILNCNF